MPRRRELRGVAFGLLGAFVSRNNDLGGYWALGKLYKHARASNTREVRVDILRAAITPPNPEFKDMVERFRQKLAGHLAALKLPNEWLKCAAVTVSFCGEEGADTPEDPFECIVTLTDDLGHVHQARDSGVCWVHDPAKELESGRAIGSLPKRGRTRQSTIIEEDEMPRSKSDTKLSDGDSCKVVGGMHAGKSGTVHDINTSITGAVTITVVPKNGERFKTLAKNVEVAKGS
jgi:hypothetical protein